MDANGATQSEMQFQSYVHLSFSLFAISFIAKTYSTTIVANGFAMITYNAKEHDCRRRDSDFDACDAGNVD